MALGEFEQLVLLAVLHLDDEAYGVPIVDAIETRTGRTISRSSLYVTFERLEAKGLLKSELRPGDDARGGRMRRYVRVTPAGVTALKESRHALLGMWQGLEPLLGDGR